MVNTGHIDQAKRFGAIFSRGSLGSVNDHCYVSLGSVWSKKVMNVHWQHILPNDISLLAEGKSNLISVQQQTMATF